MGVIISENNFALSEKKIDLRKTILALDGQINIGYHVYHQMPLSAVVTHMLKYLPETDKAFSDEPLERQKMPVELVADSSPIRPVDIATAVNDLLATQDASTPPMLMASDIGDCLFTALEIDQTNLELVAPGYYATMGFGVPAGLGLQAATGRRPIILVGDGAFQMTGWELGNCPRYGWDPIVLLFNNSGWGMLRAFQPGSAFNDLSPGWQYADMAAHMGGEGIRVETRAELKAALDRAMATRGRFQLIEIIIPKGVISKVLDRFVARLTGQA
jgi:indolepyruvate decarboxylase